MKRKRYSKLGDVLFNDGIGEIAANCKCNASRARPTPEREEPTK